MEGGPLRGPVAAELSRRGFLQRASALGLGSLILGAVPLAERVAAQIPVIFPQPDVSTTLLAFADTIIPGRPATRTDLGDPIPSGVIAGVDSEPGAVEADVHRLFNDPLIGFQALAGPIYADLSARSLPRGGPFVSLPFDRRVEVVLEGLDFGNDGRVLYEAGAAVPFTAFCAAAVHPVGSWENASGYRVMGYPGAAPNGYRHFSYRRRLARGRTKRGYLP
jgi:hypothetical protein